MDVLFTHIKIDRAKNMNIDVEDLLDKVIKNNLDASIFSRIDESDMKVAPNILEFCIGKKFLNLKPYPRQIQLMLNLFEDYCPGCSDPKLVKNMFDQPIVEILDRVQLLNKGKCPKCKKTRNHWYKKGVFTQPWELCANMGQRSGKSAVVAMCTNYQLHRLVMLKNPAFYYDLLPNSPLHGTFTATTHEQAYDTLYEPFVDYHSASPWFTEYYKLLDYYGGKLGEELYKNLDTIIYFRHKKISIYAKGPDKRKLRGRTRWMSAIDEVGWFGSNEDAIKLNADEIHIALERSLSTLRLAAAYRRREMKRYDTLTAMFYNISSPSHANDKIMRLVREGAGDPTKYVATYATWEANPKITRLSLDHEFRKDPVAAERDYGACPPIANSPFIADKEKVMEIFKQTHQSKMAKIEYCEGKFKNGNRYLYTKLNFSGQDKIQPYIIALDAGYSFNSFGMTISHWDVEKEKMITDLVVEVKPKEGKVVNFSKVYENSILPAIQALRVGLIISDRWQAIKILHDAETEGVSHEQYSLGFDDFHEFKLRLLDDGLEMPRPEEPLKNLFSTDKAYEVLVEGKPVMHLALQLMTVREIGRRVLKGEGLEDDLFRCITLSDWAIHSDEYDLKKGGKKTWNAQLKGAVRLRSNVNKRGSNIKKATSSISGGAVGRSGSSQKL